MKIFYTDVFELPLPDGHRFPMSKYRLLRERINSSAIRSQIHLLVPQASPDDELSLVHDREYIRKLETGDLADVEERRIGFPWSKKMLERSRRSTGASVDAGFAAMADRVSVNLSGGTHHAFADCGQGYCVFNDTCVAARVLQQRGLVKNVAIVDLDVHQGNGTAAICQGDQSIFTLSIHCDKNYPFRKTDSDLDYALPVGCEDGEYLDVLDSALAELSNRFKPELVFYVSGADPYSGDRLGQLSLSKQGLLQRDQRFFEWCAENHLPTVVTMGGGYSPDIQDIVDIHFETVFQALGYFENSRVHL